ncbi:SAM-dependent methyltransferase [Saccharopolyspora rosea]|uniref:SAM-dependent methyltransferase n=1 Tax=Saccharopolyspora rosea TaxID=524884 RepID=UPI0021D9AFA6|nr:SAM-dependent methyltransferase [Saccharopolyspora rosea]
MTAQHGDGTEHSSHDRERSTPPPGVDPTVPVPARAYDAWLGGKDNYEADRATLAAVETVMPSARHIAIENRRWLIRAVRYLAKHAGISQFLDCGSGLPTRENVHQIAQRHNPDAVVVYVDHDPIVQAHGRALLVENEQTHFAAADLTRPDELLANDTVTRHIDFREPLALIQCGTIHHVADELDPRAVMRSYVDALPSGSYVALSHFVQPEDDYYGDLARQSERKFRAAGMKTGWWRPRQEILSYFEGLELLEPGLVPLVDWWPEGPLTRERLDADELICGAIGRKP